MPDKPKPWPPTRPVSASYLQAKFEAHINVEICASISSVKYLYKYLFKGFDAASLIFTSLNSAIAHIDEIKAFQEARYVTPPGACWRLFEFELHGCPHTVCRLPVHLPDEDTVIFNSEDVPDGNTIETSRCSKLLAFFRLCSVDNFARNLTYAEVPLHYKWEKQNYSWIRRRNNLKIISRLYNVNVSETERFALRILLLNIKGPTSFEYLKTGPDGTLYSSFHESAVSWLDKWDQLRVSFTENLSTSRELECRAISAPNPARVRGSRAFPSNSKKRKTHLLVFRRVRVHNPVHCP